MVERIKRKGSCGEKRMVDFLMKVKYLPQAQDNIVIVGHSHYFRLLTQTHLNEVEFLNFRGRGAHGLESVSVNHNSLESLEADIQRSLEDNQVNKDASFDDEDGDAFIEYKSDQSHHSLEETQFALDVVAAWNGNAGLARIKDALVGNCGLVWTLLDFAQADQKYIMRLELLHGIYKT